MLQAALDNGLDLPYFCWHPAMGSVGACRLCAVRVYKDENDTKGKIMMACMTPAKDGTRMSMNDPEAIEFRRYVIEWLMTNHPHDCPVCDEGGECHLQDMTTMCGHVYRRYQVQQANLYKPILGAVRDPRNEPLHSVLSLRAVLLRSRGRPRLRFLRLTQQGLLWPGERRGVCSPSSRAISWRSARLACSRTRPPRSTTLGNGTSRPRPSVCIHCGLGCNTIPGARYGSMRRVVSRFNGDVNGYFLCDRGRFGYDFADAPPGKIPGGIGDDRAAWEQCSARRRV